MSRTYIQKLQNRLRTYHKDNPATPDAIVTLDKMSKYEGRGMKTPHMVVCDSGDILLEFFGPKRRLGLVLDPKSAESSWFLILMPLTTDSGWIKDTPNYDDLVRRFLQDT